MKILVEISDEAIIKDDVEEASVLNFIESGIYYMARVGGNYNIGDSNIKISKYETNNNN